MFSCIRNAQLSLAKNPQLKIISFQNYKHWFLTWSDKAFKDIVVNRAWLHGGSLKITLQMINLWKGFWLMNTFFNLIIINKKVFCKSIFIFVLFLVIGTHWIPSPGADWYRSSFLLLRYCGDPVYCYVVP